MAGRIGPALAVSVATEADRDFAGARRLIVTRSPASVPKTGQGPWFGFTAWFGGGDEVAPYIRRCRFEVPSQPRASDHQHLSNALSRVRGVHEIDQETRSVHDHPAATT